VAESQDFELKYDGRVLVVTIIINTDQDPDKLARNIQRVAKGPRLDALVCTGRRVLGRRGEDAVDGVAE
jgi:hypothetical protein